MFSLTQNTPHMSVIHLKFLNVYILKRLYTMIFVISKQLFVQTFLRPGMYTVEFVETKHMSYVQVSFSLLAMISVK